jgi:DNA-binding transcriptional LysR family regulator
MELRQLRYFAAVARSGSYTAAAAELHVVQPAIWKQVRSLEQELGVPLFARSGRMVRLTSAGADILDLAERALASAAQVAGLATALRSGLAGTVAVGAWPPHITGFLADTAGVFHREHPRIRLDIREVGVPPGDDRSLLRALDSVDLVTATEIDVAELERLHVYDVHVVAVPPPRSPLRRSASIDVRRLRDEALLAPPAGYLSRTLLNEASRAAGFTASPRLESASPAVLVALAEAGMGTAVVAEDALPSMARRWPRLLAQGKPLRDGVFLYWRSPAPPAVTEFAACARRLRRAGGGAADRRRPPRTP